jgi:Prp8 binding protein
MDCSARIWNVEPFAAGERCVRLLQGVQHNFEKNLLKCAWSPCGKRVACGSSDRLAYVWTVSNGQIEYVLPGRKLFLRVTNDRHSNIQIKAA